MTREELLKVVKELRDVITQKEITPQEAKNVAEMLKEDINKSITRHQEEYIESGKFT